MHMFNLSGRTALITGSSRGIGLEVARALAGQGATVILNGRHADTLAHSVSALQAQGHHALSLVFDIEDIPATLQATDQILEQVGNIDILFANAALQHREPLATFPQHEFERILFANLTAQWALGRHLAVRMMANEYGRIIFTGSITAQLGRQQVTAYTAAKAALHGLVRQWTSELAGHGVTVNAIAPGYIQTEFTQALVDNAEFSQWLNSRSPSKGWGQPEDIASTAVFLAAQESQFVSGQVITVDGGMTATMM